MADGMYSSDESSLEMDTMVSSTSSLASEATQLEESYLAQACDVPWDHAWPAGLEDVQVQLPVEPVDTRTVDHVEHRSESEEEPGEQEEEKGEIREREQEEESKTCRKQAAGSAREREALATSEDVGGLQALDDIGAAAKRQTAPVAAEVPDSSTPVSWVRRYAGTISSAISSAGGMMRSPGGPWTCWGCWSFLDANDGLWRSAWTRCCLREACGSDAEQRENGSQTVRWHRISMIDPGQITDLLQKACESTGFAYAEVWLRQHRHEAIAHGHGAEGLRAVGWRVLRARQRRSALRRPGLGGART
eukprot:758521-Hanusia_phi.AAC.1